MKSRVDRSVVVITVIIFLLISFFYVTQQEQIKEESPECNSTVIIKNEPTIRRNPYEINALDRLYNPLRYPYKSVPYFNGDLMYPNMALPSQVVGCGARNIPCLGGTQIPIRNGIPALEVSDINIAPINIRTRGPRGMSQQVGSIAKILGNHNEIYPLYGRKKYPRDDKWEYYTMLNNGVKVPLAPRKYNFELGENDKVRLRGLGGEYRVTLYDDDFPQYIPY